MTAIELFGIIPAIIFPAATLVQLAHLVKVKSSEGASWFSWSLFALGNVSLFIYTEKYHAWQSILGLLGTAALQLAIIVLIFRYRAKENSRG